VTTYPFGYGMRVADEIRDTSRFDKELDESPEASFEVPVLLHDTAERKLLLDNPKCRARYDAILQRLGLG
jgi:hypothetical protein